MMGGNGVAVADVADATAVVAVAAVVTVVAAVVTVVAAAVEVAEAAETAAANSKRGSIRTTTACGPCLVPLRRAGPKN